MKKYLIFAAVWLVGCQTKYENHTIGIPTNVTSTQNTTQFNMNGSTFNATGSKFAEILHSGKRIDVYFATSDGQFVVTDIRSNSDGLWGFFGNIALVYFAAFMLCLIFVMSFKPAI